MPDQSKDTGPAACPACHSVLKASDTELCPECGQELGGPSHARRQPRFLAMPEMRYQNAYLWLVLLSSIDVMLTYIVLFHWGGFEANPVAAAVIETRPFYWATLFKFCLVVLAIILCEVVGRMNDREGRRLSIVCVIIGAIPVVYTISLLLNNPEPLAAP